MECTTYTNIVQLLHTRSQYRRLYPGYLAQFSGLNLGLSKLSAYQRARVCVISKSDSFASLTFQINVCLGVIN